MDVAITSLIVIQCVNLFPERLMRADRVVFQIGVCGCQWRARCAKALSVGAVAPRDPESRSDSDARIFEFG